MISVDLTVKNAATPNPSRRERLLSYFEFQSKAATPAYGRTVIFLRTTYSIIG